MKLKETLPCKYRFTVEYTHASASENGVHRKDYVVLDVVVDKAEDNSDDVIIYRLWEMLTSLKTELDIDEVNNVYAADSDTEVHHDAK